MGLDLAHSPNKQKIPSLIPGMDTNSFTVVSGRASGAQNLANQICGTARSGDSFLIREQLKAVFFHEGKSSKKHI